MRLQDGSDLLPAGVGDGIPSDSAEGSLIIRWGRLVGGYKSKSSSPQNLNESCKSVTVNPGVSRRERMALLTDSGSRLGRECCGTCTGGMTRTTVPTFPTNLRQRSVAPQPGMYLAALPVCSGNRHSADGEIDPMGQVAL